MPVDAGHDLLAGAWRALIWERPTDPTAWAGYERFLADAGLGDSPAAREARLAALTHAPDPDPAALLAAWAAADEVADRNWADMVVPSAVLQAAAARLVFRLGVTGTGGLKYGHRLRVQAELWLLGEVNRRADAGKPIHEVDVRLLGRDADKVWMRGRLVRDGHPDRDCLLRHVTLMVWLRDEDYRWRPTHHLGVWTRRGHRFADEGGVYEPAANNPFVLLHVNAVAHARMS